MNQTETALVIIDVQRGFMPKPEKAIHDLPGFGELGVSGGEKIVAPINALTRHFANTGAIIATTQDWHPKETAHFSRQPNYTDTWPTHCVGETPGAMLAPNLLVAQNQALAHAFRKGQESITKPTDDKSYTGALATAVETKQLLPEFLKQRGVKYVVAVGLALGDGGKNKLCLDSTAVDLKDEGFEVTIATDAVEAVLPENRQKSLDAMSRLGIKLATTKEILDGEVRA